MNPIRTFQLILLRHGQTTHNLIGKMQGHIDTDLTSEGQQQAKCVAQYLAEVNPWKIYSSDLKRAVDTAIPLAEATNAEIITDQRLRETHLGQWSGLTHSEVDIQWPGARIIWKDDPHYSPPTGETKFTVAQRGMDFMAEVISTNPEWPLSDRPIVIVSHNGFISALTAALLDLPQAQWGILGSLTNGGWAVLHKIEDGPWRLHAWNRTIPDLPDLLTEKFNPDDSPVL